MITSRGLFLVSTNLRRPIQIPDLLFVFIWQHGGLEKPIQLYFSAEFINCQQGRYPGDFAKAHKLANVSRAYEFLRFNQDKVTEGAEVFPILLVQVNGVIAHHQVLH